MWAGEEFLVLTAKQEGSLRGEEEGDREEEGERGKKGR